MSRSDEHLPLFFIDDATSLSGQILGGLQVYDAKTALKVMAKRKVDEILIALPSVSRPRKSEIIQLLEPAHLKLLKFRD